MRCMGIWQAKSYVLLSLAMSIHFLFESAFIAEMLYTSIDASISFILQARLDILKRTRRSGHAMKMLVIGDSIR